MTFHQATNREGWITAGPSLKETRKPVLPKGASVSRGADERRIDRRDIINGAGINVQQ